ncbi:hypothetical protein ColTof3_12567 [Colletotrichum tofieldiae]|nr:hypothetical protein ColTof3_12567 [Colletotrichum tofieldiae]
MQLIASTSELKPESTMICEIALTVSNLAPRWLGPNLDGDGARWAIVVVIYALLQSTQESSEELLKQISKRDESAVVY